VVASWTLSAERLALNILHQTSLATPQEFLYCLDLAVRLGFQNLGAELMRRNASCDMSWFPRTIIESNALAHAVKTQWLEIHAECRSYFADLVPALRGSLDLANTATASVYSTMPEPLIQLIAKFVRGPFEL
jgi:hypothetical protein